MSLVNSTTTASTNITAPSTGSQSQVLPLLNVVNVTQSSLTPNQTQPTTDLTSSHEVAHLFSQYNSNATTTMPSISGMSTRAARRKARTPTSDSSAPTLRQKPGESAKGKSRQRRSTEAEAVTTTAPGYKTDSLTFDGPDKTKIPTPRGLAPKVQCLLAEVKSMNEELKNLKTKPGVYGDIFTKLEFTDKDEMATYQKTVNTAKEYHNPYFYTQKGVGEIEDIDDITVNGFSSCKYKAIKVEDGNKQSMSLRSHIEIKNIPDGKIVTVDDAKTKDMALKAKYETVKSEVGTKQSIFDDLRTTWLSNTQWWNKTQYEELVQYLDTNKTDPVFNGVKEMIEKVRLSDESYIFIDDTLDPVKMNGGVAENIENSIEFAVDYLKRQSFGRFILISFFSGGVIGTFTGLFLLMLVACCRKCETGTRKRVRSLEDKKESNIIEMAALKKMVLELKTSIQTRTTAAVSLHIPNVNNITPRDRDAIDTLLKKLSNKGTEESEEITLDDLSAIRKLIDKLDKNHAEEDQEPSTSGVNKPKIKFAKTETDSESSASEEIGSDSESEEIDSDSEEKDVEETKASETKHTEKEKTGNEIPQAETSQTETSQSETSQTETKKGEGDPPETVLNMSLKHKDKKKNKISCINFSCRKSKNKSKNQKAENLEENVLKSHQPDEEILGKDEGKDNNQPVETNESLKAQSEDLETISQHSKNDSLSLASGTDHNLSEDPKERGQESESENKGAENEPS